MISLHYTSHTKAYNTIYTACNIVEAIYSFTKTLSPVWPPLATASSKSGKYNCTNIILCLARLGELTAQCAFPTLLLLPITHLPHRPSLSPVHTGD